MLASSSLGPFRGRRRSSSSSASIYAASRLIAKMHAGQGCLITEIVYRLCKNILAHLNHNSIATQFPKMFLLNFCPCPSGNRWIRSLFQHRRNTMEGKTRRRRREGKEGEEISILFSAAASSFELMMKTLSIYRERERERERKRERVGSMPTPLFRLLN
jgi:hypothetical protein